MEINKVLIVDDDAAIRRIAEICLSQIGKWEVFSFGSAKMAIEFLAGPLLPDLILLDVMMPELDGLSTFQIIRQNERTAQIPIIFMTAKVQKQEVKSYYDTGVSGVIFKPFDPITLHLEIRTMLGAALKIEDVA